jgi:hypothetical protein
VYLSVFSWVRNITFVQNCPIQVNGRSTVVLVRESLTLEAIGSSNFLTIVNSVSCLKEYCLPLSVFMAEEHQPFAKSSLSSEWKKHCSSCKRIIYVRSKRV